MLGTKSFDVKPRFPFVSLVTAIFFSGSVFLSFNTPLLVALLKQRTFSKLQEVFLDGIIGFWSCILDNIPVAIFITSVPFLTGVFGFLIKPLDQLLIAFGSVMFRRLSKMGLFGKKFKDLPIFSPVHIYSTEYVSVLSWIIAGKHQKAHWEWEYFHYQMYWSLCTNVLVFVTCTIFLMDKMTFIHYLSFIGIILFILLYGVARSFVMGITHAHYVEAFKQSQIRDDSIYVSNYTTPSDLSK